jgi:hypothetical protein
MLTPQKSDHVLRIIERLDRRQIIQQMRGCTARFPIDLTDEWLQTQPVEELRHVYAAICIQCDVMPEDPARAA